VRVLVTAARASIGRALVDALLADERVEHVLAVDAEPGDDTARLTWSELDVTRPRDAHDLLYGPARRLGITAVVHGPLHPGAREEDRRVHALNVEATRELLLGCEHHPTIERFVYRSAAEVYAIRSSEPNLLDEDAPLELDPGVPQWVRDRVEADLTVCARAASSRLAIVVLRHAEVLARGTGSQLWDYLQSRVCLRPLGFDPMVNVLSMEDAIAAIRLALDAGARGVFNVPGADTLPLSRLIARWGRHDVPVPGPLLAPLYALRTRAIGLEFRYDLNFRRFHFGGVVDGTRATGELGYRPRHPIRWPRAADQRTVSASR
jgi:UDP-glucose 4-epimerase